jgi:hypothetical protein
VSAQGPARHTDIPKDAAMNDQSERRKTSRGPDETLSPEYLAVLEVCGGEIRESDKPVLEERRRPETDNGRRISDRRPPTQGKA